MGEFVHKSIIKTDKSYLLFYSLYFCYFISNIFIMICISFVYYFLLFFTLSRLNLSSNLSLISHSLLFLTYFLKRGKSKGERKREVVK